MSVRILSVAGWFMAAFMTLSAPMFTWLRLLFDITSRTYLIGCALVSLAVAVWLEFNGGDEDGSL